MQLQKIEEERQEVKMIQIFKAGKLVATVQDQDAAYLWIIMHEEDLLEKILKEKRYELRNIRVT